MSLRLQIVLLGLLVAVVAAAWLWLTGPQNAVGSAEPRSRAGAATRVLVEPLVLAQDRVEVRAVGTGEALRSAEIHPSVSGEVVEIAFEAEQRVAKGDVLLRLDDEHQQLAARLVEVTLGEAKREVERLEKLVPSGAVSQVRLEAAQAALASAAVQLEQARAELDDRTVRAPFDGVIGLTDLDVGDRVSDDSMIATLDDRSSILVDFSIPEDFAARIAVGDPVVVHPWSAPELDLVGQVAATGSRIDPASRSLQVRARIPNPDDRIRPGTSFEVELVFEGDSYPKVREVAVLWSSEGAYLWRANDGEAEKVFVELVRRDRGEILVKGPLAAGDLIVVEGVQGLRIGQPLDPRPLDDADRNGTGAGAELAPDSGAATAAGQS